MVCGSDTAAHKYINYACELRLWERMEDREAGLPGAQINLGAHSSMRLTFRCHENRNRGCLTSAKWIITAIAACQLGLS